MSLVYFYKLTIYQTYYVDLNRTVEFGKLTHGKPISRPLNSSLEVSNLTPERHFLSLDHSLVLRRLDEKLAGVRCSHQTCKCKFQVRL